MLIRLSADEVGRCQKFARQQLETSAGTYARRGQFNKDVIERQIVEGKIAEIAAYKFLRQKKFDVAEPDFTIYEGGRKNYGADLTDGTLFFHIKSQNKASGETYGVSWVFQKNDPLVTAPQASDFIVVTTVAGNLVEVEGVLPAAVLKKEGVYKEPKTDRLKTTKTCIYLEDLSGLFLTY